MHISRLVIKNFRNLRYIDVTLSEKLNVIVGPNGVGKSNLLYAVRLLLDPALSYSSRQLAAEDFHAATGGPRKATDIIVAAEFSYDPKDKTESNFARLILNNGVPRLAYRFRPNPTVTYQIENEGRSEDSLVLDDYEPQLVIGQDVDYHALTWKDDLDEEPEHSPLSRYHLSELPALRDVVTALRAQRTSPLARLLQTVAIDDLAESRILRALLTANARIERTQGLRDLSKEITEAYGQLLSADSTPAVTLQLAEPTMPQVLRSLNLLINESSEAAYGLERNGLGFNNLLYAAMQIESFRRGSGADKAGKLILIEEPEAHLHPHAQESFLDALRQEPVQTLITTHSVHVTSRSGVSSVIALSADSGMTHATKVADAAQLDTPDIDDLDRYLDATKSALLFARRVVLVEGGAELQLLHSFARYMKIDLAKRGISVIAVHGTHFEIFSRLFDTRALAQRCAIIRDGDDFRDENGLPDTRYDDGAALGDVGTAQVRTFATRTTLEYAICQRYTLAALRSVALNLGAVKSVEVYDSAANDGDLGVAQRQTYRLSMRFGKARFAQLLSKSDIQPPPYISAALGWVNS